MTYDIIFFSFNDTAPTEIYTLSLHDALPISGEACEERGGVGAGRRVREVGAGAAPWTARGALGTTGASSTFRSEEHTSELQSRFDLVCRLLLEKKKKKRTRINHTTTESRSAY